MKKNNQNLPNQDNCNDVNNIDKVAKHLGEAINSVNTITTQLITLFHSFFNLGGIEAAGFKSWKEFFINLNINVNDSKFAYKIKKVVSIERKLKLKPSSVPWTILVQIPFDNCQEVWDEARRQSTRSHPTSKQIKKAKESIRNTRKTSVNHPNEQKNGKQKKEVWNKNKAFFYILKKFPGKQHLINESLIEGKEFNAMCSEILKNTPANIKDRGKDFRHYYKKHKK